MTEQTTRKQLEELVRDLDWYYHTSKSSLYITQQRMIFLKIQKLREALECPYSLGALTSYGMNWVFDQVPEHWTGHHITTYQRELMGNWFSDTPTPPTGEQHDQL